MSDLIENWFVLQVITGQEEKIESYIQKLNLNFLKTYLPKKKIKIKKKGNLKDSIIPLYPGYIFIIGKWDIKEAKQIKKIPNTVKYLGGFLKPGILKKEEIDIIKKITNKGVCEYSTVIKEGNKIKIISGALKEFEGLIESVDRRKQRAFVRIPLLNTTVKVSLGFEYLEVTK